MTCFQSGHVMFCYFRNTSGLQYDDDEILYSAIVIISTS
jgi:hypothetical protein